MKESEQFRDAREMSESDEPPKNDSEPEVLMQAPPAVLLQQQAPATPTPAQTPTRTQTPPQSLRPKGGAELIEVKILDFTIVLPLHPTSTINTVTPAALKEYQSFFHVKTRTKPKKILYTKDQRGNASHPTVVQWLPWFDVDSAFRRRHIRQHPLFL